MSNRIAISMQKGGVGKTVTTMNLSGALADRGYDVLLVDADPQGGSTLKLGFQDAYRSAEWALFDVLAEMGELSFEDLGRLRTHHDEFDLIPAHVRNFKLERHLYSDRRGFEALKQALDRADWLSEYDYVLIDCPPNLGPLSDGSLLAAGNVLFPSHANIIAEDSLHILFDQIETLEDEFNTQIQTLGAVLNQVGRHGVADEMLDWFHNTFGEEYVFQVPDYVAVEHAIEERSTIYGYDPEAAGYPWDTEKVAELRECYDRIADHIEVVL